MGDQVDRMTKNQVRQVVFVCTGNICRSPMAEYLLRTRLGPDTEWQVASAGVSAVDGLPPSRPAVLVMKEFGVNIAGHRSRLLTDSVVRPADLLVAMTAAHHRDIVQQFPFSKANVYLLKTFLPGGPEGDVMDPIGLSDDVYRAVRDEIDVALSGLIAFMHAVNRSTREGL